jgi:hypothetical protein
MEINIQFFWVRITGFQDFSHRPEFEIPEKMFLSKGPNRAGVSLPSPEGGKKDPVSETSCFVVSGIPGDGYVHKLINSECYTPSSEPFRFYMHLFCCAKDKCGF